MSSRCFFFFNGTATTEIYTLSLHDALPIWKAGRARGASCRACRSRPRRAAADSRSPFSRSSPPRGIGSSRRSAPTTRSCARSRRSCSPSSAAPSCLHGSRAGTCLRLSAPAIELPVEHSCDRLAQAVEPGALAPVAAAERARDGEVSREHRRRRIGKVRVGDLLIGLEVPAEAPAIEVARADRDPVIAQDHLRVQNARLVLKYLHAVAQQLAVEARSEEHTS